jgi:hypothetical protein
MAWIKITPPPDLLIAGRKTLLSLKTFIQKVVKLAGKLWVTVRQIILRRDLLLAAKRTQFTAFAADQFSGPDPAPQTRSPTVPAPLTVPVKLTFPIFALLRLHDICLEIPLEKQFRIPLCPNIILPRYPVMTSGAVQFGPFARHFIQAAVPLIAAFRAQKCGCASGGKPNLICRKEICAGLIVAQ